MNETLDNNIHKNSVYGPNLITLILTVVVLLISYFFSFEIKEQRDIVTELKFEVEKQKYISTELKLEIEKQKNISTELKLNIEKLIYEKNYKAKVYNFQKRMKSTPKINILSLNAKVPDFVLSPVNKIATLSMDETGLITRTKIGKYPEKIQWVIIFNNQQKLARVADNELQYRYYRNFEKGLYKVYLKRFNGKNYEIISNILSYESR